MQCRREWLRHCYQVQQCESCQAHAIEPLNSGGLNKKLPEDLVCTVGKLLMAASHLLAHQCLYDRNTMFCTEHTHLSVALQSACGLSVTHLAAAAASERSCVSQLRLPQLLTAAQAASAACEQQCRQLLPAC